MKLTAFSYAFELLWCCGAEVLDKVCLVAVMLGNYVVYLE